MVGSFNIVTYNLLLLGIVLITLLCLSVSFTKSYAEFTLLKAFKDMFYVCTYKKELLE